MLVFDRSSHQIYYYDSKSWLVNLLCCDFWSLHQQFWFQKVGGVFIREGAFITKNMVSRDPVWVPSHGVPPESTQGKLQEICCVLCPTHNLRLPSQKKIYWHSVMLQMMSIWQLPSSFLNKSVYSDTCETTKHESLWRKKTVFWLMFNYTSRYGISVWDNWT